MVETSPSNAGGEGRIPGGGAKIPRLVAKKKQNIRQKQHCHKFNKHLKMVHMKNLKKIVSPSWIIVRIILVKICEGHRCVPDIWYILCVCVSHSVMSNSLQPHGL